MKKVSLRFNKTLVIAVSIIIGFSILGYLFYCNNEHFIQKSIRSVREYFGILKQCTETVVIGDKQFCKIGYGTAISDNAMDRWFNGVLNYTNHEGKKITLSSEQYRSSHGFIPPAISYFPYGNSNDLYRPEDLDFSVLDPKREGLNQQEGNEKCMQACIDTNCTAVQTEVPQNCYTTKTTVPIPAGLIATNPITGETTEGGFMESKGDCKGKPTHTCTLFYDSVESADDAYYTISQDQEQINGEFVRKHGVKYYQEKGSPNLSPWEGLPSEAVANGHAGWCKPNVSKITNLDAEGNPFYGTWMTNVGAPGICSCLDTDEECKDLNCCLFRNNLITSEWSKYNAPYFNLPLNVTRTTDIANGSANSLCPARDQDGECCGLCEVDGSGVSSSCKGKQDWANNFCMTQPNACTDPLWQLYCEETKPENSGKRYELRSCPPNKQFMDGTLSNPVLGTDQAWATDLAKSQCMLPEEPWWVSWAPALGCSALFAVPMVGWLGVGLCAAFVGSASEDAINSERKDPEECLADFIDAGGSRSGQQAYTQLTKCCNYLDQACLDTVTQPYCKASGFDNEGILQRGCFGNPNVLTVDEPGIISACSDNITIPPSERCVKDEDSKLCKAFPYGCSEAAGKLWEMRPND